MSSQVFTDENQFLAAKGVKMLDDPTLFVPVGEVHSKIAATLGTEVSLDEFISQIGEIMREWGQGSVRPRNGSDRLGTSPSRGMDALSEWLTRQNAPKSSYEEVMASAYSGFLYERYSGYIPNN